MIFSNKISKFGRGKNVSAYMPSTDNINIYYFNSGIILKSVSDNDNTYTLENISCNLPYNEVIKIDDNCLVTRLDKSIGIYINE